MFSGSSNLKFGHSEFSQFPVNLKQTDLFNETGILDIEITESEFHDSNRKYKCNQCGKAFTHSAFLRRHLRVHTGEKPFICNVCTKGFTQLENLKVHYRIHTGEKPFICPVCKKSFTTKDHVKRHSLVHMVRR